MPMLSVRMKVPRVHAVVVAHPVAQAVVPSVTRRPTSSFEAVVFGGTCGNMRAGTAIRTAAG